MSILRVYKTPKGTDLPIMNMRGKEYLEVKYRLVWFREERPLWRIETEFIKLDADKALARAVIRDESGNIMAMAHKLETPKGFPDFIEKAETGSIGRALAMIGFGTQFCADELDEGERIVDSPVAGAEPAQAEEKPKQANPLKPTTGSDYKVTFGKFKGMVLSEIDAYDLNGYVKYLLKNAQDTGKEISGPVKDFIERAEALLETKTVRPKPRIVKEDWP